jgi:tetrahydromethanopterin S-methyltransferase subunit H
VLKFTQEQKVCQIGDILIGGQPSENPTVLIGSIFYTGHRIVSDIDKGVFDKQKARALLDREAELSAETGNPRIIDVVGETTQALIKYIEFVAANCKAPILVDSATPKVRMETIEHFANTEVAQRLVYNSIDTHYSEEELACIKDCGIKSAIILAFDTRAIRPKDRIKLLENNLLGAAQRAGVENILIDTGVLDVPGLSWSTLAIWEVKNALGYPSGCAPSNALHTWKKMKAKGSPAFEASGASVFVLPISWGADFILYGPIASAPWVYPACATMDAMVAYGGQTLGIRPTKEHPLYKIFRS